MKRIILFLMVFVPAFAFSAGGGGNKHIVEAPIDEHDKASLQRGVRLFVSYCTGCHSAKYMRYERLANDLDIPLEVVEDQLIFGEAKIGDPILSAMPEELAAEWFGVVPPDLSLEAKLRGEDWLYSYLINFYEEKSRPWGVDNRVFEKVGMPHVLADLEAEVGEEAFKSQMADLTNFMVYMAEPIKATREKIGMWVLIFLAIFFIPVYLLNREYWKNIH